MYDLLLRGRVGVLDKCWRYSSGKAGALCCIAVDFIGSILLFFLVFDMLIQEDESELRCTLRFIIAWMDTVNQSINLISRPRRYPEVIFNPKLLVHKKCITATSSVCVTSPHACLLGLGTA